MIMLICHFCVGERPFECDICQKRFTLKHSMMRHRKKHSGAPPRSFDDDEDSNGGEEKCKYSFHVLVNCFDGLCNV